MIRNDADETLRKIIQIAETINEYYLILSIDGIDPNLASRILAEIGDIKRFETREAQIAYLGLDPNISQSGQLDGDQFIYLKEGKQAITMSTVFSGHM